MASIKNLTKLLLFLTYGTTLGWKDPGCHCMDANNIGYVYLNTSIDPTDHDIFLDAKIPNYHVTDSGVIHRTVGSCYLLDTPRDKNGCWRSPNLACYLDTRTEHRPRETRQFLCNDEHKGCGYTREIEGPRLYQTYDCSASCAKLNGGMSQIRGDDAGSAHKRWCRLATSLTHGH